MADGSRSRLARCGSTIAPLLALLQGCVTQIQGPTTSEQRAALPARLGSGELRLTCELACSGAWGSARRQAKGLHEQALWLDLAAEVVRVGYSADLPYFYLARAAEGLRQTDAAITYYRLSLASPHRCDGLFDTCDGVDVRREARLGLERLLPPDQRPGDSPPKTTSQPASTPDAQPKD